MTVTKRKLSQPKFQQRATGNSLCGAEEPKVTSAFLMERNGFGRGALGFSLPGTLLTHLTYAIIDPHLFSMYQRGGSAT